MNYLDVIIAINDNTADSLDLPTLYENIFWNLMMVIVTFLSMDMLLLFIAIELSVRKIISMDCAESVSNSGL
jgi:hypothetical protein